MGYVSGDRVRALSRAVVRIGFRLRFRVWVWSSELEVRREVI